MVWGDPVYCITSEGKRQLAQTCTATWNCVLYSWYRYGVRWSCIMHYITGEKTVSPDLYTATWSCVLYSWYRYGVRWSCILHYITEEKTVSPDLYSYLKLCVVQLAYTVYGVRGTDSWPKLLQLTEAVRGTIACHSWHICGCEVLYPACSYSAVQTLYPDLFSYLQLCFVLGWQDVVVGYRYLPYWTACMVEECSI